MFGTIRKHQQWLWIFIIAIIIVSFVVFFSPDAQMNFGQRNDLIINGKPVTIDGKPMPQDEFVRAFRETRLSYFFRSGGKDWPENDRSTAERLEFLGVIFALIAVMFMSAQFGGGICFFLLFDFVFVFQLSLHFTE